MKKLQRLAYEKAIELAASPEKDMNHLILSKLFDIARKAEEDGFSDLAEKALRRALPFNSNTVQALNVASLAIEFGWRRPRILSEPENIITKAFTRAADLARTQSDAESVIKQADAIGDIYAKHYAADRAKQLGGRHWWKFW